MTGVQTCALPICGVEVVQVTGGKSGQGSTAVAGAEKYVCDERDYAGNIMAAHDICRVPERDQVCPVSEICPDRHDAAQFHQLGAGLLCRIQSV